MQKKPTPAKKATSSAKKPAARRAISKKTQARKVRNVKKDALIARQLEPEVFDLDLLPTLAFTSKGKITPNDKRYLRAAGENLLLMGYSTYETASMLKIPQSTVAFWLRSIPDEKKAEIEINIAKSVTKEMAGFLNTALRSLGKVAQYCSGDEYLAKHDPDKVAELFDVIGNRSFQLIEAQQRAQMAQNRALSEYTPNGNGKAHDDDSDSSASDTASADAVPETTAQQSKGDDSK